jgi:hypothetical protein
MRNISFSCAHDVMDLGCNLAYQLAVVCSSDIMNDLERVASSPPDEAIMTS